MLRSFAPTVHCVALHSLLTTTVCGLQESSNLELETIINYFTVDFLVKLIVFLEYLKEIKYQFYLKEYFYSECI